MPLNAVTLFTDGSGKTRKSVVVWQDPGTKAWKSDTQTIEGSTQVVELAAVVRAFQLFQEPFYLITDYAYVANIVKRTEGSVLKDVSNDALCRYLTCLYTIVRSRTNQYFVSHIRAHSWLSRFLTEGNCRANKLTVAIVNILPNIFEQAKLSLFSSECTSTYANVSSL